MNLELLRNNELDISSGIQNAVTTVTQGFNNAFDKGLEALPLEEGIFEKVKNGFEKIDIKKVAAETIDKAIKSTLKTAFDIKAKTVDAVKDLGKAVRDSDLKGGLRTVINLGVNSIKGIPTAAKKVITSGVDLILGETFDNELKKVMTSQKNTLSRIATKCDKFEEALSKGDEKAMKRNADGIKKDLEKIALISETINRGNEVLNRYELMKNKGSTVLSPMEQEICMKISN